MSEEKAYTEESIKKEIEKLHKDLQSWQNELRKAEDRIAVCQTNIQRLQGAIAFANGLFPKK